MSRRNSPTSLKHFKRSCAEYPYRASFILKNGWDYATPSPYLIVGEKICRGGRSLAVFKSAAVRDYFVDGNFENAAQVEPDGAVQARPYQGKANSRKFVVEKGQALAEQFRNLTTQRRQLSDRLVQLFLDPVRAAIEVKDIELLRRLAAAVPDSSLARTMVVSALSDAGLTQEVLVGANTRNRADITDEQATTMLTLAQTERQLEPVEEAFGNVVRAHITALLEAGARQDAITYAQALPDGVFRALACNYAEYGQLRTSEQVKKPGRQ